MRKIALLNLTPPIADGQDLAGAEEYFDLMDRSYRRIASDDTEIVHKSCPPGIWKAPNTVIDYFIHGLSTPTICKKVVEVEEEGFDAAIIVCGEDPGLRQARTLVDIPVIGEFEATAHFACMLGHKFGVVTWPTRPIMARTEKIIERYGLSDRAIYNPVEPILDPAPDAEEKLAVEGFSDPESFIQHHIAASNRLIERGADVIVLNSTGVSCIAENAGLTKIEEVDIPTKPDTVDVPVLNAISIPIKMAEMRVDLRKELGIPSASRLGLYQKVEDSATSEDEVREIREAFESDWEMMPNPWR